LDEPDRASNGYKQYRTAHLVRLLQIRRLSGLGVPLSQIAVTVRSDADDSEAMLRALDAELSATVERLQQVRTELAKHRAGIVLLSGADPVAHNRADTDRALVTIYSRMFDDAAVDDIRAMAIIPDVTNGEFHQLPADAGEATIRAMAERMVPLVHGLRIRYPWISDPATRTRVAVAQPEQLMRQVFADLYNSAQLQVLAWVNGMVEHTAVTGDEP